MKAWYKTNLGDTATDFKVHWKKEYFYLGIGAALVPIILFLVDFISNGAITRWEPFFVAAVMIPTGMYFVFAYMRCGIEVSAMNLTASYAVRKSVSFTFDDIVKVTTKNLGVSVVIYINNGKTKSANYLLQNYGKLIDALAANLPDSKWQ